jgi:hypothetical protein
MDELLYIEVTRLCMGGSFFFFFPVLPVACRMTGTGTGLDWAELGVGRTGALVHNPDERGAMIVASPSY